MNDKNNAMQTPIEDQREAALKHYNKAAKAIQYWSNFVENAIKNYIPEERASSDASMGLLEEEKMRGHGNATAGVDISENNYDCEDEAYAKWYWCPKCVDDNITKDSNYCPNCGIKLNWVGQGT